MNGREILMQDLKDLGVPHSVLKEVNTDGKIEMLLTSVIHDFGESTLDRSPYEHMRDVNTFLHALITSVGTKYEDIIQS